MCSGICYKPTPMNPTATPSPEARTLSERMAEQVRQKITQGEFLSAC